MDYLEMFTDYKEKVEEPLVETLYSFNDAINACVEAAMVWYSIPLRICLED